jgi:acetolactate synthase-1/2/3 large subunit
MRVYEAIVKGVQSVGVDACIGGAGQFTAGLMLALKHSAKIKPVIARHEQAASFMACGYAIYSNRLRVCFATAGPHYNPNPAGILAAIEESIEKKLEGG